MTIEQVFGVLKAMTTVQVSVADLRRLAAHVEVMRRTVQRSMRVPAQEKKTVNALAAQASTILTGYLQSRFDFCDQ